MEAVIMARYESNVKQVPYSQEEVYSKLSNLRNFESIKRNIGDPRLQDAISNEIPADQADMIRGNIEKMEFTPDSVKMELPMMGEMSLNIIEREPAKCIKFATENSPIGCNLWIQVLPVTDGTSKMKLTLDADINMFIKAMIGNKLQSGLDRVADMIASFPFPLLRISDEDGDIETQSLPDNETDAETAQDAQEDII